MKKIIFVNILILSFILLVVDMKLFNKTVHDLYMGESPSWNYFYQTDELDQMRYSAFYPDRFFIFRDNNPSFDKPPVLLLGCSYTYGHLLEIKDSLAGQIQKLTNRPIYNLGTSQMDAGYFDMLLHKAIDEHQFQKPPEYIIYTYMFHHIWRISNWYWSYYNYYRKENFIPSQKYNILYKWYTYTYFKNTQLEKSLHSDDKFLQQEEIFLKLLKDMKKTCDKHFPNSKFVVLIYNDVNEDLSHNIYNSVQGNKYKMQRLFDIMESAEFKKKIEDMGIEVITTQELIGRKMDKYEDRVPMDKDGPHPSISAWREITPKLVERLKL
ncbi:hypothetical protein IJ670_03390 [bacterium]|nr:hypothetical protein [bacterium]